MDHPELSAQSSMPHLPPIRRLTPEVGTRNTVPELSAIHSSYDVGATYPARNVRSHRQSEPNMGDIRNDRALKHSSSSMAKGFDPSRATYKDFVSHFQILTLHDEYKHLVSMMANSKDAHGRPHVVPSFEEYEQMSHDQRRGEVFRIYGKVPPPSPVRQKRPAAPPVRRAFEKPPSPVTLPPAPPPKPKLKKIKKDSETQTDEIPVPKVAKPKPPPPPPPRPPQPRLPPQPPVQDPMAGLGVEVAGFMAAMDKVAESMRANMAGFKKGAEEGLGDPNIGGLQKIDLIKGLLATHATTLDGLLSEGIVAGAPHVTDGENDVPLAAPADSAARAERVAAGYGRADGTNPVAAIWAAAAAADFKVLAGMEATWPSLKGLASSLQDGPELADLEPLLQQVMHAFHLATSGYSSAVTTVLDVPLAYCPPAVAAANIAGVPPLSPLSPSQPTTPPRSQSFARRPSFTAGPAATVAAPGAATPVPPAVKKASSPPAPQTLAVPEEPPPEPWHESDESCTARRTAYLGKVDGALDNVGEQAWSLDGLLTVLVKFLALTQDMLAAKHPDLAGGIDPAVLETAAVAFVPPAAVDSQDEDVTPTDDSTGPTGEADEAPATAADVAAAAVGDDAPGGTEEDAAGATADADAAAADADPEPAAPADGEAADAEECERGADEAAAVADAAAGMDAASQTPADFERAAARAAAGPAVTSAAGGRAAAMVLAISKAVEESQANVVGESGKLSAALAALREIQEQLQTAAALVADGNSHEAIGHALLLPLPPALAVALGSSGAFNHVQQLTVQTASGVQRLMGLLAVLLATASQDALEYEEPQEAAAGESLPAVVATAATEPPAEGSDAEATAEAAPATADQSGGEEGEESPAATTDAAAATADTNSDAAGTSGAVAAQEVEEASGGLFPEDEALAAANATLSSVRADCKRRAGATAVSVTALQGFLPSGTELDGLQSAAGELANALAAVQDLSVASDVCPKRLQVHLWSLIPLLQAHLINLELWTALWLRCVDAAWVAVRVLSEDDQQRAAYAAALSAAVEAAAAAAAAAAARAEAARRAALARSVEVVPPVDDGGESEKDRLLREALEREAALQAELDAAKRRIAELEAAAAEMQKLLDELRRKAEDAARDAAAAKAAAEKASADSARELAEAREALAAARAAAEKRPAPPVVEKGCFGC